MSPVTQVADDVWQVHGFPPHAINAYIAGNVLVDALTRWGQGLVMRAVGAHPVESVALTHCHPDHQGAASLVRERFGVPLAVHEDDAGWMDGSIPVHFRSRVLRRAQYAWSGPCCPVDRRLKHGDMVGDFRVVHAPGHTPGHVVFFREADRLAIAGDIVSNLNPISRVVRLAEPPHRFSTDPHENRRSMTTLLELEPSVICFGHGPPLRDLDRLRLFVDRIAA